MLGRFTNELGVLAGEGGWVFWCLVAKLFRQKMHSLRTFR